MIVTVYHRKKTCWFSHYFSMSTHDLSFQNLVLPTVFFTSPDRWAKHCDQRVCIRPYQSVCLYVCRPMSVCPLAFLKNRMSKFSNLNTLPVAVARSSFNDSAIQYALLVLWMTSCFHIMGPLDQNQAWLCFVKFARWRHRVRCPMSTIALFKGVFDYRIRTQIHTEKRKQKQLLQSKTLSLTVWIRIRLL